MYVLKEVKKCNMIESHNIKIKNKNKKRLFQITEIHKVLVKA
jgi:hypothetical protein